MLSELSIPTPVWLPPPVDLALQPGEIHLWRASLALDSTLYHQLVSTLTPDERQRAERFYRQEHQSRFVACRAFLRAILGHYLDRAPEQIQFCYGSHGKPAIEQSINSLGLEFNLSHSENIALYAIALHHRTGIDLEAIRPVSDLEQLSKRFFAPQEHLAIQSLPVDERLHGFFQYWTLKEAVLKAVGDGLSKLEEVEVAIADGSVQLIQLGAESLPIGVWSLWQCIPAPGYVASLAVEGTTQQFRFWQWQSQLL